MGAHSQVEDGRRDGRPAGDAVTEVFPALVPAPRRPVHAPVHAPVDAPALAPAPTLAPFHALPDAPPAGLDAPLPPAPAPWGDTAPPLRRLPGDARPGWRSRVPLVAAGIGAVVVVAAGLTSLASTVERSATPTTTPTTGAATGGGAAAPVTPSVTTSDVDQCVRTVASELDTTVVPGLTTGGPAQWASVVAAHRQRIASVYGAGSREDAGYAMATDELIGWLSDASDTRTYDVVVDDIAPKLLRTCGQTRSS